MEPEIRNCQSCKNQFTIEPEDFAFYEKIKVPPPTWCPMCRLMRRLSWRNERNLYRRKCDAPGHAETIITMYSPEIDIPVYDQKFWWSDEWDAGQYAREYDFSRTFFEQWHDLLKAVPTPSLINLSDVQSDYCNFTYQSKSCYLNFASDMNEDTAYLYHSIQNKNCFDLLGSRKNEKCYELNDCDSCYESEHLTLSESCIQCRYCYDCRNCQNCLGCVGERNKQYCVFNEQLTQSEYRETVEAYKLETKSGRQLFAKKFSDFLLARPHKYSNSRRAMNSTGDYLNGVKNCRDCFDVEGPAEDCRFVVYGVTDIRSTYDGYAVGVNLENCYDVMDMGSNTGDVSFCGNVWEGYSNRYCYFVKNCSHCFGCVGLRGKEYCILNKQYSKESYAEMLGEIINHMKSQPFIDKLGRVYDYGEFFPPEFSFFAYNESIALEYLPLAKEEAQKAGYAWRESVNKNNLATKFNDQIPDSIKDVDETILLETLACVHGGACRHNCTKAFRIIRPEFELYKQLNIPLPELCVNCRHYERLARRNPLKLWHRTCQCQGTSGERGGASRYKNTASHSHGDQPCPNEFETSYAPPSAGGGSEIIYCESCYNNEVA